ncbi:hypothetical protein BEP19_09385 [Ammoniphilus oxalaticus]|uniref:Cytochrome c oxidase assembly protein n=1 Tax=Ammoniphilus oxalaticus TaxID=66863 RepID=A0A419SKV0_9BACL|nr:cytochrome c oxidase assembly protein [Ammoniphilus oxalaticus]RKD24579.1 hypothetical protein BEP19_09385 [Ammoniphilus oxalaticus]
MNAHLHNFLFDPIVVAQWILAFPFLLGIFVYALAVLFSNRKYRRWPLLRTFFWLLGSVCSLVAVIGPLASKAYVDFFAHMIGHLLLGMLGPLLMALGAPLTLILRTLPIHLARRLTALLRKKLLRMISDPVVAALLNIGGLWILYMTNLYAMMHEYTILHVLIHLHVFLAGYVFTTAMIEIDPNPHRASYTYRMTVLVSALAAHCILSKYIYADPPQGVLRSEAERGGMLMFYGGDVVDALIILILCLQWYRASRPIKVVTASKSSNEM